MPAPSPSSRAARPVGRDTDHPPSGLFEHRSDGVHGEGLAGPCPPDDHLHAESLGADAPHGVDLIGPQRHPTCSQNLFDECGVDGVRWGRVGCEQGGEFGLEAKQPACRPLLLPPRQHFVAGGGEWDEFGVGEHGVGEPVEQGDVAVWASRSATAVCTSWRVTVAFVPGRSHATAAANASMVCIS